MKRALVTGASGFIGRHLTAALAARGLIVRALVRDRTSTAHPAEPIEVVEGDITRATTLPAAVASCDTIFHLAAHVHDHGQNPDDDRDHVRINVDGTRHLVEAAVSAGVGRFVFFSSVKAMGEGAAEAEDESVAARPQTAYGRAKLAAEEIVLDAAASAGMHAVCLRLPLVYGAGNRGNLQRMIAAIDRGRFPPLPEVGNRRSMVHVANVVDAAILVAEHPDTAGQRLLVTDADDYSSRALYTSICRALGKPVPSWSVPLSSLTVAARVGDLAGRLLGRRAPLDSQSLDKLIGSARYDCARLRALGYRPTVGLDDALPAMVADYRKTSQP